MNNTLIPEIFGIRVFLTILLDRGFWGVILYAAFWRK